MAMDTRRRAHAVVQTVAGSSKALGLEVVAEGVDPAVTADCPATWS